MIRPESLLQEAIAAVAASDLATAGERFEKAADLLAATRPEEAFHALESATRIALMRDDVSTARNLLERTRSLGGDNARLLLLAAEVAEQDADPAATLAAWEAVANGPDRKNRQRALIQLADLARADSQHERSVTLYREVLRELPTGTTGADRAELLLQLAVSQTALSQSDEARATLDEAQLYVPRDGEEGDATIANRLDGQRAVLAFMGSDPEGALRIAETVRERSVQLDDIMTYLAASSLIGAVHEGEQRLVEAYDTYIRARESLTDLLGPDGRALAHPAVELFEARLGPDKFNAVWNEWVAWKRATTSSPA